MKYEHGEPSAWKREFFASCLREFSSPFFAGLPTYWAAVPFARLEALFADQQQGRLPPSTGGPGGVAAFCDQVHARYFAPYAHGFSAMGAEIMDIGWGAREPAELAVAQQVAQEVGGHTRVLSWRLGDSMVFDNGSAEVRPCLVG